MPGSALADAVMERLDDLLERAANPERAAGMRAYMRGQFAYFGIPMPELTRLARAGLDPCSQHSEADLVAISLACWARPEREFQYVACLYLRRHVHVGTPGLLTTVRSLITTRSWWDTVDSLAAHTVGPLVSAHPTLVATMDTWIEEENLWLIRTAILHQLTYRDATDAERLFRYCARQASHRDFFVRKAIGWALREYSRSHPAAVRSFVDEYRTVLSPLSTREALKRL